MLSTSLQEEAERKKQLEEELQHSRDAVRSSVVAPGPARPDPARLSPMSPFCVFTGFNVLLSKASKTQETLDLVQEELSEQKLVRSDLERRSRERQLSLDRQVGVSEGGFTQKASAAREPTSSHKTHIAAQRWETPVT